MRVAREGEQPQSRQKRIGLIYIRFVFLSYCTLIRRASRYIEPGSEQKNLHVRVKSLHVGIHDGQAMLRSHAVQGHHRATTKHHSGCIATQVCFAWIKTNVCMDQNERQLGRSSRVLRWAVLVSTACFHRAQHLQDATPRGQKYAVRVFD